MQLELKKSVIGLGALLILSLHSKSVSAGSMMLERVDGENILRLNDDQTYENEWVKSKSLSRGVYEESECWLQGKPDTTHGNYMFYTADGDSCCVSLKTIGSRKVIKQIAGYQYKVCVGGVFSQK